nr:FAD-binding domain-containing protein [Halomonas elongata]
MVGFPEVCRHRAFQAHTEALPWRDDTSAWQAWTEGRTGYPLVDAAMRQLRATGWMHNRLRMVTAMFLAKHLLIDWRHGERFFLHHLVDGEFAANNGGWQWAASTGTDAVPYFRIFNPITQSRRFDPDGRFIAEWLPELADLPAKERHDPSPNNARPDAIPCRSSSTVPHAPERSKPSRGWAPEEARQGHESPPAHPETRQPARAACIRRTRTVD